MVQYLANTLDVSHRIGVSKFPSVSHSSQGLRVVLGTALVVSEAGVAGGIKVNVIAVGIVTADGGTLAIT